MTLHEQMETEKQELKDTIKKALLNFTENTGLYVTLVHASVKTISTSCSTIKTYQELNLTIVE